MPALGYKNFGYSILPVFVLVVEITPFIVRSLMTSLGEVMQANFIYEARVRGLPRRRIVYGHALRRAKVTAVMSEVGLPAALYDELPVALSAGERQCISIARALILNPKLLILDETLTALDQREQSKLIELFSWLQQKNDLTYVFIWHILAMVRRVCTRIAVMYLGKMVGIADNRELVFDPQHPHTKALLSATPTREETALEARDLLLEDEPPSPIDIPPGCSFASRCPHAFGRCRIETPALAAQ